MQEKIDEIMDNFDFKKVQKVMKNLNWSWWGIGIPDESEIRAQARKFLKEAFSKKSTIYSGGLKAEYFEIRGEGQLALSFVVTDWITYYG